MHTQPGNQLSWFCLATRRTHNFPPTWGISHPQPLADQHRRQIGIAKMRIACLQFAPQVGDVSSNIARAEAVLSKADPEDLEDLDLLVLPEMAFSGMPPLSPLKSPC